MILPSGQSIIESIAILEYLNEKYPTPHNFYPGDAVRRAQIRGFCEVINSGIHPYQNLKLLDRLEADFGADRLKWAESQVAIGANTIENLLISYSSPDFKYCFGNDLTAADIVFYPQIYATKNRWKIDTTRYLNVERVFANLSSFPEFIDTAPQNQPDCPK